MTIHMAASLDGYIARADGRTDWMETSDHFAKGEVMDAAAVTAFLSSIDCYVMGSRTYETALRLEAEGLGWPYGDTPTVVLTSRELPRVRASVEFHSGDLTRLFDEVLRPRHRRIWCAGGGVLAAECLRLGLADEVSISILPILIGDGIPFAAQLNRDVSLHLADAKTYANGVVELRYEVMQRAAGGTRIR